MHARRLGRSSDAIGRVGRGGATEFARPREFAEKRGRPGIRGTPTARGDPEKKSPDELLYSAGARQNTNKTLGVEKCMRSALQNRKLFETN